MAGYRYAACHMFQKCTFIMSAGEATGRDTPLFPAYDLQCLSLFDRKGMWDLSASRRGYSDALSWHSKVNKNKVLHMVLGCFGDSISYFGLQRRVYFKLSNCGNAFENTTRTLPLLDIIPTDRGGSGGWPLVSNVVLQEEAGVWAFRGL